MAKKRDFKAIYANRVRNAHRLGYDSLGQLQKRRKEGDLSPLDEAERVPKTGGKHVTDLGGDRWTWSGDPTTSSSSLNATFHKANNSDLDYRVQVTARWTHPDGRSGTATTGGRGGVDVGDVLDLGGGDALDGLYGTLQAAGRSRMPAGAVIVHLSCFFFPAGEAEEAA